MLRELRKRGYYRNVKIRTDSWEDKNELVMKSCYWGRGTEQRQREACTRQFYKAVS
jgi:hypothetical protein